MSWDSTERVGPFTDVEIGGLLAIVAVVVVLSWTMTDLSGTSRMVTVGLAGVAALVSATLSLYAAKRLD